MSNFAFLHSYDLLWSALGADAERNFPSDPNTTAIKLRILAERIAEKIAALKAVDISTAAEFIDVLQCLQASRVIERHVLDSFHFVRITGNKAAHEHSATEEDALESLRSAYSVCGWFYVNHVNRDHELQEFVTPGLLDHDVPLASAARKAIVLARPATCDDVIRVALDVKQKLNSLAIPTGQLDEAVASSRRRMNAALAPFRLGVVGEVKSGKSTLINALIGEPIAFVDGLEATPIACLFRHGVDKMVKFLFKDGREKNLSIEDAQRAIDQRRHDSVWIESIDHAEFTTVSPMLKDFEIWDSPGIGGSEINDFTARDFLTDVTGVIWVFDVQFLGSAGHIHGLQRLKTAKKKIVGVVNKIDLLDDPEQTPLAIDEADAKYGAYVDSFIPLSASSSFAKSVSGEVDPKLEDLRKAIIDKIVRTAEADRQKRIDASIRESAREISRVIAHYGVEFYGRLGLVSHIEHHLGLATERVLSKVGEKIDQACALAFRNEQAKAERELASLIEAEQLGTQRTHGNGSPTSCGRSFPRSFRSIRDNFDKGMTFDFAYKQAAERIVNELCSQVERECFDVIALSSAAIPNIRITAEPKFELKSVTDTRRLQKAANDGAGAALIAALLFGVAGVFAPPLWIGVLASIPIGLSVGAKSFWGEDSTGDFSSMHAEIKAVTEQKRGYLRDQLLKRFPIDFETMLRNETKNVLGKWSAEVFQHLTKESLVDLSVLLKDSSDLLARTSAGDLLLDKLAIRPLAITPGDDVWQQLFAGSYRRVDLFVPELHSGIHAVLKCLGPDTEVRLLTVAGGSPEEQEMAVSAAFGNWPGRHEVRLIRSRSGQPLNTPYSLIILDEVALITHDQLEDLGVRKVVFSDYPKGLRAAERRFAETWEGKATDIGDVVIEPLVRLVGRGAR